MNIGMKWLQWFVLFSVCCLALIVGFAIRIMDHGYISGLDVLLLLVFGAVLVVLFVKLLRETRRQFFKDGYEEPRREASE